MSILPAIADHTPALADPSDILSALAAIAAANEARFGWVEATETDTEGETAGA